MKIRLYSAVLGALLLPIAASAHEFWISPLNYTLEKGAKLQAQVRSGEYFLGREYPFMPSRIVSAKLHNSNGESIISGVAGKTPAITISQPGLPDGLQIISYQSTGTKLVHTDFEDFQNFLHEDGLQWVEQAHIDRAIAKENFSEMFTRYTRSLVVVGDDVTGPLEDRSVGLPFELLVINQPWSATSDPEIAFQLLEEGRPKADAQVTIFRKSAGEKLDKSPLKIRSNEEGIVVIPRENSSEILASAVIMKPGVTTAWHSHWVSTTFALD